MSEEEKKIIETINDYIKKKEELGDLGNDFTINFRDTKPLKILLNLIEKQQKTIDNKNCLIDVLQHRIEELLDVLNNEGKINYIKPIDIPVHNYISEDKIRERIKELEEQQETLKYDGNVCFADYEQFCKNLNFLKEQIKELLEEN